MKDKRIEIRIDRKDYIAIEKNAKAQKMNISQYMQYRSLNIGSEDTPYIRCTLAQELQKAEAKMQTDMDREVLREVGKKLWIL